MRELEMPYLIEANGILAEFPKACAYCDRREATSSFRQPFSKMRAGTLPGDVSSETLVLDLPACESCARWFRRTRVVLFLIGFVAIIGSLLAVLASVWFENEIPILVWMATVTAWVGLRLWRGWRRRALRLAYFRPGTAIYAVRDEAYANELAEMNGLSVDHKVVLIKFS